MYQSIINKHHNISLEPESHTYTLSNSEIEFNSVTEFINTFFLPFDKIKVAKKLTQLKKYQHMSMTDILQDWEQRRHRGTVVHKEIEDFLNLKKHQINTLNRDPKSQQGVKFLQDKCMKNQNNYLFPEVKIYSEELQLAGTIDLMIFNEKTDHIYLIDWKTNVDIKKTGYNQGIKHPTNTIDDCNFNRYRLQLSMYQYILEQFYAAKVNGLYIVHLKDDKYHVIECDFQHNHITNMIESKNQS